MDISYNLSEEENDKLLNMIMLQQTGYQRAFGHIVYGLRNCINHRDPKIREDLQAEVDNLKQGILLSHVFAIWEEGVNRRREEQLLSTSRLNRINAFRHIRHTFAHSAVGIRANRCRKEFEEVMSGEIPFKGVVWNREDDTINLAASNIALDCMDYLKNMANYILVGAGQADGL